MALMSATKEKDEEDGKEPERESNISRLAKSLEASIHLTPLAPGALPLPYKHALDDANAKVDSSSLPSTQEKDTRNGEGKKKRRT